MPVFAETFKNKKMKATGLLSIYAGELCAKKTKRSKVFCQNKMEIGIQ